MTATATAARPDERSRRLLERVSRARELGIVIAIVLVFVLTTVKNNAAANTALNASGLPGFVVDDDPKGISVGLRHTF